MHFFHSFWTNLHLTENFYTDMSVVSVTNMRYVRKLPLNFVSGLASSIIHHYLTVNQMIARKSKLKKLHLDLVSGLASLWKHCGALISDSELSCSRSVQFKLTSVLN